MNYDDYCDECQSLQVTSRAHHHRPGIIVYYCHDCGAEWLDHPYGDVLT